MKKKLLAIFGVIASLSLFAACGGSEEEASSSTTPPPASESASDTASDNDAHTHTWATDWSKDEINHWHDCNDETCEEKSDSAAHSGGEATCTGKAICETCGGVYGEVDGENHASEEVVFVTNGDGTHTKKYACCNEVIETVACTGGEATCEDKAVCALCEGEYGDTLAHTGGTATCTDQAICDVCEQPYGDTLAHTGGTANCTDKAICDVCEQPYGEVDEEAHTGTLGWVANPESSTHTYEYSCCGGLDPENEDFFCRGGEATCQEKAVCQVCGGKYGELNKDNHAALGEWDTSAEDVDTATCGCGATVTFKKLFTEQKDIVWATAKTLDLSAEIPEGTLKSGSFNGAAVSGSINAIDLSALPLQNHGEGTLELTVTDKYGVDHTVKYALRVITNKFAGSEDRVAFRDATRGTGATCTAENPKLYGYYILTDDLDTTWSNTDYSELWSKDLPQKDTYGFAGTIIGEKEDGSAPVIKGTPKSGGIFGYLQEATIKNIIIEDIYYRGSAGDGAPILATIAKNTTLEDVTFKVTGLNASVGEQFISGWGKGWIINNVISKVTFKNVNFVNESGYYVGLGRLLTDGNDTTTTFENCTIENFAEVLRIYGTTAPDSVTGITIKNHVHDFENSEEFIFEVNEHWKGCATCEVEDVDNKVACFGGGATCTTAGFCEGCGNEYVLDHTGGTTNCTDRAICDMCKEPYGEVDANNHKGVESWDTSSEDKDVGTCACGETVEFIKKFTKAADINFHTATTMDLTASFPTGATVSNVKLDGAALAGTHTLAAIDFSTYKEDLQKHGEHTLTMTVTHEDVSHEVTYPVRLITRTFAGNADKDAFIAATRGVRATCTADNPKLYGYYILTADLDAAWGSSGFAELWSSTLPEKNTYGFAGTIIGEKEDGSAPVISTTPRSGGVFGYLVGATIKNIIFNDIWFQGSAGAALVSTIAIDTTFEDVTFKITGVNTGAAAQATTGWGKGWIINNEINNVTFRNVSFVNATASAITVGRLLTDQNDRKVTFENCTYSSNLTITNAYGTTAITAVTGIKQA